MSCAQILDSSQHLKSAYGCVATSLLLCDGATTPATPAILSAYNIASVSHTNTGVWLVAFDKPMPDVNYIIQLTARGDNIGGGNGTDIVMGFKIIDATSFQVEAATGDNKDLIDCVWSAVVFHV